MAAPLPAAPAAARTQFTFVAGAPAAGRAPSFDCDDDSPLVTSLVFLPWVIGAAGTPARVSRSSMVGALIKATRRPMDGDLDALRARSILANEMLSTAASTIAHALDRAGAFENVHRTVGDWDSAIPGFLATMSAAAIATVRLTDGMFFTAAAVNRHSPDVIKWLDRVSIGSLIADDAFSSNADSNIARILPLATILLGWKDSADIRDDDESDFRVINERLLRLLAQRMPDPTGNASVPTGDTSYLPSVHTAFPFSLRGRPPCPVHRFPVPSFFLPYGWFLTFPTSPPCTHLGPLSLRAWPALSVHRFYTFLYLPLPSYRAFYMLFTDVRTSSNFFTSPTLVHTPGRSPS